MYFRYYIGRRSKDDERQFKRFKNIVNRFKGILVKIIKDKGSKFDDYSISPKIRQILLHWGYELKKVISSKTSFLLTYKNEILLVQ